VKGGDNSKVPGYGMWSSMQDLIIYGYQLLEYRILLATMLILIE
jgi:hypothetical protein